MKGYLLIAGFVLVVIIGLYAEGQVWNECLKDHSWLYCQRVLNK